MLQGNLLDDRSHLGLFFGRSLLFQRSIETSATDRNQLAHALDTQTALKTAGRENPKRWATTSQQPSPWRGRSEQISFIQMGCEARKLPAPGEIFFLTSSLIELIEFGRFAARDREKRGEGKPETFTFLGFTHYCGKRRSNGAFIVWRKTAKKRMVAKLHALKAELRLQMHEPVAAVGAWLRKVVNSYYRYHAVPGNIDRLSVFGQRLRRLWWLILRRRSQRRMSWDRVLRIFKRWLPAPRVLHPYPIVRFLATHPRWEPYA